MPDALARRSIPFQWPPRPAYRAFGSAGRKLEEVSHAAPRLPSCWSVMATCR